MLQRLLPLIPGLLSKFLIRTPPILQGVRLTSDDFTDIAMSSVHLTILLY